MSEIIQIRLNKNQAFNIVGHQTWSLVLIICHLWAAVSHGQAYKQNVWLLGEFPFEDLRAAAIWRLLFVFGVFLHNYLAECKYTIRPTIRTE